MRLTIEKTEAGYSVGDGIKSQLFTDDGSLMREVWRFIDTPLPPKEPAIPACLHCGKQTTVRTYGSDVTESVSVECAICRGGCGAQVHAKTKAEAIALWAGVNPWIEWSGNKLPPTGNVFNVDIKFKDKSFLVNVPPEQWDWTKVTHYRIHKGAR